MCCISRYQRARFTPGVHTYSTVYGVRSSSNACDRSSYPFKTSYGVNWCPEKDNMKGRKLDSSSWLASGNMLDWACIPTPSATTWPTCPLVHKISQCSYCPPMILSSPRQSFWYATLSSIPGVDIMSSQPKHNHTSVRRGHHLCQLCQTGCGLCKSKMCLTF